MNRQLETLLNRLPQHFAREEDSNNYKLLSIIAEQSIESEKVLNTTLQFWDVDQAYGSGLDRLGKDEGINRDGMDDEEFRKMIKIQYILNMSDGDIPTMNLILDAYFGKNFIGLEEGWRVFDEPATLLANLQQIPSNIPYKMLKRLKPAGVGLILGTKQKMDLGLNIGAAYVSHKSTKIKVPPIKIDDLESQMSVGLLNTCYKVSNLNIKPFEMAEESEMQLVPALVQGNYKKTKITLPLLTMPSSMSVASLFGGVFSAYKKTTILARG